MNKKLFDEVRIKRNMSLEKLSELTQIPLSTLMKISAGKIHTSFENMCLIAKALECSLDDFTDIHYPSLTFEDRQLLHKFHSLNHNNQNAIHMILNMDQHPCYDFYGETRLIPCYIPILSFNDLIFSTNYKMDFLNLPKIERFQFIDFAWKISSNTFVPTFFLSDVLLFQYKYPLPEEIALFQIEDQLLLRRYVLLNHSPMLQSIHFEQHPLQPIPKKKCRCLGTLHSILQGDSPLLKHINQ